MHAVWISTGKRSRIHEYLSFRAAVKTDAGTAAAAHTDESKVRFARNPPRTQFGRKRELIYSALRACIGSTEAARRAGTKQAMTAAQSSSSATEAKTERSNFPIP
jgi:hypothetical protein